MPNFLSEEQILILKQTHRAIKDKKLADRVKAILYLNYGLTYKETSKLLMFDEATLSRYLKRFREKGVEGLLELHYIGHKTRLTLLQELTLKNYLRDNTKRTVKEAVDYIQKTYKIEYSIIGATKLLHRLGFSYKKPKIIPGKADKIKQEEFLKVYKSIKTQLGTNDQIYFADSTHPEHNTKPSYGWILKGKRNDKVVKTNTGRERLNLNGALNLRNKEVVVLSEKTINSDSTIRLIKRLREKHKKGKIYVIADNASHHHSRQVGLYLKTQRRVRFIFLPSYSPNLNLIERLWRFFHLKVTWNHYFETFEEFKKETLKFFRNLKKYRPELDTLLTDNFQLVPT